MPNRRMRLASDLASICAALLLVGLLGTAFTWWGRSAVVVAFLWAAGIVALIVKVAALDSSYAIEVGTYVSAGLMALGLAATLAMWPGGPRGRRDQPQGPCARPYGCCSTERTFPDGSLNHAIWGPGPRTMPFSSWSKSS